MISVFHLSWDYNTMVEECSDPKSLHDDSWDIKFDSENVTSNFEKTTIFIKNSRMNVWIDTKRAAGSSQNNLWIVTRIARLIADAFIMFFLNKWWEGWPEQFIVYLGNSLKTLLNSYSAEKQIPNIKNIWHKHKSVKSPIQNMQASFPFFPFLGLQYFLPSIKSSMAKFLI